MMPRVEARCIEQRYAVEKFPGFAVLDRGGIQRYAVLPNRLNCATVTRVAFPAHLLRPPAPPGDWLCFGFGLFVSFQKTVKLQPLPFPADVVGNAVIRSGRLAITINLHHGRAALDDDRES